MVHFWSRSSSHRSGSSSSGQVALPAMLQPRDWQGRPGSSSSSQPSPNTAVVGVVGSGDPRHGSSKPSVGGGGGVVVGGHGGGSGHGGHGGGTGLGLLSRLGQYKRRQHEQHKRRVAEKELDTLHHRIDKLLAKMEERDPDIPLSDEEECVVCLGACATMQTFPCQHRVVCRKCFIRTIQVAVSQRSLPLRCVVCRTRISKLRHTAGGPRTVSMGTESPFHSSASAASSASALGQHLSHGGNNEGGGGGGGFLVNSAANHSSSSSSSNPIVSGSSRIHAMSSLARVSPCRLGVGSGGKRGAKPGPHPHTHPALAALPADPPRVTLTKASSATSGQFSPLSGKSGQSLARSSRTRDASPPLACAVAATTVSSSSATVAAAAVAATTATAADKTTMVSTKASATGKRGDIVTDANHVVTKGNNSQALRRARVFPFNPLFWRQ